MKKKHTSSAIEKDRAKTEALIRNYGIRFYRVGICEEIIEDVNYWRSVKKKKKPAVPSNGKKLNGGSE